MNVWRQIPGVTNADHSGVTGLDAASMTKLSFQGAPLQQFMTAAFDGTLAPACTIQVANP